MNKLYRSAATTAAFAVASLGAPALAQDAGTPVYFDGPYISGAFGLAVNASDQRHSLHFDTNQDGKPDPVLTVTGANAFSPGSCDGVANGPTPGDGCRTDQDDIEYTIRAGYDRRMGNIVVGGLIEASGNNAHAGSASFSITPASYSIDRNVNYSAAARLRAGFSPGAGGVLFYATGGGTVARIDHIFSTTNTANSFREFKDKKLVFGWQAGGGAEAMITDRISLGLEYLFSEYQDSRYFVNVSQGSAPPTNPFLIRSGATNIRVSEPDLKVHSFRASLSYHF